jgi:hypothetical protein
VDISNESIRCLLIDPRAALVIMRPGDVFEASVFNVSEKGMRRVIGPGLGDTPAAAVEALGEIVSQMAKESDCRRAGVGGSNERNSADLGPTFGGRTRRFRGDFLHLFVVS